MYRDLTKGRISSTLLIFSFPIIAGDLLQQLYNIADTLIVGRVLGTTALAAVGSSYTLMTFLTSVFLGLGMGAGALFSIYLGQGEQKRLRLAVMHAFVLIIGITLLVNAAVYLWMDPILRFLQIPNDVWKGMKEYLTIIFAGLAATSLYNFGTCLLRAMGNSSVPLFFLGIATAMNIGLDLLFVAVFGWGIAGAAIATILAQYVSGIGITLYILCKCRDLLPRQGELTFDSHVLKEIFSLSALTCLQQSVMNFGILMIQGLVNSFGSVVMAGFAAAVKIDTLAYLPVQDFGNAYSTFIAQNYGAENHERIRKGTRDAFGISMVFSVVMSAFVCGLATPLMRIFVESGETSVIAAGVQYLHIEGAFYIGIGCLSLFYGYCRGIKRAGVSVVLTVCSLGTRVLLAYALAPVIGEIGIWMAIPIGWGLADLAGAVFLRKSMVSGGHKAA